MDRFSTTPDRTWQIAAIAAILIAVGAQAVCPARVVHAVVAPDMIQPLTRIADLVLEGGGVKGNALGPARWPTFRVALNAALPPAQRAPEVLSRLDVLRAIVHTGVHGRTNAERGDSEVMSPIVSVDTGYVDMTDFSIARSTRQRLFDDGHAAAEAFLTNLAAAEAITAVAEVPTD